ncbi:hypothetical protein DIPPA_11219 [Diplonema papillatum]|nr:hypothetical protein DIPPA_11219 [Diplonema papillatum]KAJ9460121.1 hypothetical protein DIPPA_11219 [Diplonema papillatum]
MAAPKQRLEDEVMALKECLERGVDIARGDHAQSRVELMLVSREKDALQEHLRQTVSELSGDVYLAFSEVQRLGEENRRLASLLEQRDADLTALRARYAEVERGKVRAEAKLAEELHERAWQSELHTERPEIRAREPAADQALQATDALAATLVASSFNATRQEQAGTPVGRLSRAGCEG